MKNSLTTLFCGGLLSSVIAPAGMAALSSYSQDFEALDRTSGTALSDDGWGLFANVYAADGTSVIYNYGLFPAPNDIVNPNISVISDASVAPVGNQGLAIFNDYNNGDHGTNPNRRIEINVFQEQTISAADIGQVYEFSFIAAPDSAVPINANTLATGFIKTLDPGAGFATTNFQTVDTSLLVPGNTEFAVELDLSNPALEGQIIQFGFSNTAGNFEASAVNYDNIRFDVAGNTTALVGDYNGNGTVDAADYTIWADNFNATVNPFDGADGNGDGVINAADYTVWADNFGNTVALSSGAFPIPEPTSLALLASGGLAILGRRR